ncbi:hypothetical protein Y1Q_0017209 [Alligator mississippiensis]|uniref:Uncharacterized protein n=1 Tax=Alligator mississippiensis TaxID=8496 RepID=A0A151NLM4_ALLMI|nr:hypothetical protein Y1Q_0017209 [Alligator mississippiensis]
MHLVAQVTPNIERQDTVIRLSLTLEKRVAIAIMRLAMPASLREQERGQVHREEGLRGLLPYGLNLGLGTWAYYHTYMGHKDMA